MQILAAAEHPMQQVLPEQPTHQIPPAPEPQEQQISPPTEDPMQQQSTLKRSFQDADAQSAKKKLSTNRQDQAGSRIPPNKEDHI
jgi:hypothetical protein